MCWPPGGTWTGRPARMEGNTCQLQWSLPLAELQHQAWKSRKGWKEKMKKKKRKKKSLLLSTLLYFPTLLVSPQLKVLQAQSWGGYELTTCNLRKKTSECYVQKARALTYNGLTGIVDWRSCSHARARFLNYDWLTPTIEIRSRHQCMFPLDTQDKASASFSREG